MSYFSICYLVHCSTGVFVGNLSFLGGNFYGTLLMTWQGRYGDNVQADKVDFPEIGEWCPLMSSQLFCYLFPYVTCGCQGSQKILLHTWQCFQLSKMVFPERFLFTTLNCHCHGNDTWYNMMSKVTRHWNNHVPVNLLFEKSLNNQFSGPQWIAYSFSAYIFLFDKQPHILWKSGHSQGNGTCPQSRRFFF